jgi:hypothetical protein
MTAASRIEARADEPPTLPAGEIHAHALIFPIADTRDARTFLQCLVTARFDPPTGM